MKRMKVEGPKGFSLSGLEIYLFPIDTPEETLRKYEKDKFTVIEFTKYEPFYRGYYVYKRKN